MTAGKLINSTSARFDVIFHIYDSFFFLRVWFVESFKIILIFMSYNSVFHFIEFNGEKKKIVIQIEIMH